MVLHYCIVSIYLLLVIFSFHPVNGEVILIFSNRLTTGTSQASLNGTQLPDFDTLKDGLSILDLYGIDKGMNSTTENNLEIKLDQMEYVPSLCTSTKSASLKMRILDAIEQTLKFYESHIDLLPTVSDPSVGLSILKAADDKHGKLLQGTYNISDWISNICNQAVPGEKEFCEASSTKWNLRNGQMWKSAKVVKDNGVEDSSVIGHEKEYMWGKLNGQCQLAVVTRCEVPYVCERTLYDTVPRSMYFLTHQMFQRILTEQTDCESAKRLLNEEVNDKLCSKMYQEANLISKLDYPNILRDLFSEYVAICGYKRYPNFFREDWIESLLSWQSRSGYGCFTNDINKNAFITSDTPIVRRKTYEEIQKGSGSEEELCLPHFTTVGLSALAMSWDYMQENC
ncbi:unnamed protein product [Orchesella dallaii]|uniref:Uncharacterized protein n=1 Tax=Orchesella dallaii TaxID=48710 RepID=A0ABP1RIU7_9HEXA